MADRRDGKEPTKDCPEIVSRETWLEARKALLAREKAFDRERDRLTEARRRLPLVRVDKPSRLDAPDGVATLGGLFAGKRQLVYRVMFEPARVTFCKQCFFVIGNHAGCLVRLAARGAAFAAGSRAPLAEIQAFKRRMKWTLRRVSPFNNNFNYDFHITLDPAKGSTECGYPSFDFRGEPPGLSAFVRDGDAVLHSHSTHFRGLDALPPMRRLLDRTPLDRRRPSRTARPPGKASRIRLRDSCAAEGDDGDCACCSKEAAG